MPPPKRSSGRADCRCLKTCGKRYHGHYRSRGGAKPGDPPPSFTTRTCTGAGGGSCTGGGTYDVVAMNRIVFGRVPEPVASMGAASCGNATSSYEIGMCDIFNRVTPANVVVSYMYSGLGFAGRPGPRESDPSCRNRPVPTITVSLQNIPFQFFFLGGLLGFVTSPFRR